MKRPYIVYSLSKNRTTQKFKNSKFHDIIKDIDWFLQKCTSSIFSTFYLLLTNTANRHNSPPANPSVKSMRAASKVGFQ